MTDILEAAFTLEPEMLARLRALVDQESPSGDLDALARCADLLAEWIIAVTGRAPKSVDIEGRRHLLWSGSREPHTLLLGHYDTVWPTGTTDAWPFSLSDGIVRGPGVLDMKAGIVQMLAALHLLGDGREKVRLLLTADEEIGSVTSRELIEEEARRARAVFVCEPSGPQGQVKIARRGATHYRLTATGRSAHAGEEPEFGINAGVELALQIPRVMELADADQDTTVTPTVLRAGTTTNTIPGSGLLDVDVRAWTKTELERVDKQIRALQPLVEGAHLAVTGEIARLPFEEHRSAPLADTLRAAAQSIGIVAPAMVRWRSGSDANITAAAGAPTLCGMGAVGAHPHAREEHVVVAEMPRRAAFLAATVQQLDEPSVL